MGKTLDDASIEEVLSVDSNSKMYVLQTDETIGDKDKYIKGPNAGWEVGDFKSRFGTTSNAAFLLCNGQSLGDTGSGATNIGSDYFNLYNHIWDLVDGGDIPTAYLSAAKGASAVADFAALKRIYVPDLREYAMVGVGTSGDPIITIAANDAFTLGTPKDDQGQGHYHDIRLRTGTTASKPLNTTSISNNTVGDGAVIDTLIAAEPVTDGVNGTPRTGTVTRGKRFGVNYFIKY